MKENPIQMVFTHFYIFSGFYRLNYLYPVISVIVNSLPANTTNRESTSSWTARVRFLSHLGRNNFHQSGGPTPCLLTCWCLDSTQYTPPPPAVRHCLTCSPGVAPLLTSSHVCCLPMLRCLSLLCTFGLGLCRCSELVCDVLPRRLFNGSPQAHYWRVSKSQCWRALLGDTSLTWCLSYPGYLRRHIECNLHQFLFPVFPPYFSHFFSVSEHGSSVASRV